MKKFQNKAYAFETVCATTRVNKFVCIFEDSISNMVYNEIKILCGLYLQGIVIPQAPVVIGNVYYYVLQKS